MPICECVYWIHMSNRQCVPAAMVRGVYEIIMVYLGVPHMIPFIEANGLVPHLDHFNMLECCINMGNVCTHECSIPLVFAKQLFMMIKPKHVRVCVGAGRTEELGIIVWELGLIGSKLRSLILHGADVGTGIDCTYLTECVCLEHLEIISRNPTNIMLNKCANLKRLVLDGKDGLYEMRSGNIDIGNCFRLEHLSVKHWGGRILGSKLGLVHVELNGCPNVTNLDFVDYKVLKYLVILGCGSLVIDANVEKFKKMKSFVTGNNKYNVLCVLTKCERLEQLSLYGQHDLIGLGELMIGLRELGVDSCRFIDFDCLSGCGQLQRLSVMNCWVLDNFDMLGTLGKLEYLRINDLIGERLCGDVIGNLKRLKHLDIHNVMFSDECCFGDLIDLKTIRLDNVFGRLDCFGKCGSIEKINLSQCADLKDVDFMENFWGLKRVEIIRCYELKNLDGLMRCRELVLNKCFSLRGIELNVLVKEEMELIIIDDLLMYGVDLKKCYKLRDVELLNCDRIVTVDLSGCMRLERVQVMNCLTLLDVVYGKNERLDVKVVGCGKDLNRMKQLWIRFKAIFGNEFGIIFCKFISLFNMIVLSCMGNDEMRTVMRIFFMVMSTSSYMPCLFHDYEELRFVLRRGIRSSIFRNKVGRLWKFTNVLSIVGLVIFVSCALKLIGMII